MTPEEPEVIFVGNAMYVPYAEYKTLMERYRKTKKALELSIVERRVDMRFENECEEFDYWMSQAST